MTSWLRYNCVCVQNVWQEVLRCVSRWELLQQIASGGPTDAHLFAPAAEPVAAVKRRNFFSRAPREGTQYLIINSMCMARVSWSVCMLCTGMLQNATPLSYFLHLGCESLSCSMLLLQQETADRRVLCHDNGRLLLSLFWTACCDAAANGKVADSFTSIHEAPLHYSGRSHGRDAAADGVPPENVLQEIDNQELNRMFIRRLVPSPAPGNCSAVCGNWQYPGSFPGFISAHCSPSRLAVIPGSI